MKTESTHDLSVTRRAFLGSKALVGLAGLGALTLSSCLGPARRTSRRTARRVTRRTNRRLYALPAAASPVVIGGGTYYYANNAYWQPMGTGSNRYYVEVIVE